MSEKGAVNENAFTRARNRNWILGYSEGVGVTL